MLSSAQGGQRNREPRDGPQDCPVVYCCSAGAAENQTPNLTLKNGESQFKSRSQSSKLSYVKEKNLLDRHGILRIAYVNSDACENFEAHFSLCLICKSPCAVPVKLLLLLPLMRFTFSILKTL